MKTPDEIKKMLNKCPDADCSICTSRFHCDIEAEALDYIQQLENQIGELTEKVAQLEAAQPKWISVEERLPEYWVSVLAFRKHRHTPDDGYHNTCVIMRTGKYGMEERPDYYEVTHWMPLPQPPKE